jgi:hypothetical protein
LNLILSLKDSDEIKKGAIPGSVMIRERTLDRVSAG